MTTEITTTSAAALKPEQIDLLRRLRSRGFAVIVWTPDELCGADPKRVEDAASEAGHCIIAELKD